MENNIKIINGMRIDITETKKLIERTPAYQTWLKNEKRKDRIEERTKAQLEAIKSKAEKLLNKRVILSVQFKEYSDKIDEVEGLITFVGNQSLILDLDGNTATKKDRKLWYFINIVNIKPDNVRKLQSSGKIAITSDPLPQVLEINKKLIKSKKLTPKEKENQRIRSLKLNQI